MNNIFLKSFFILLLVLFSYGLTQADENHTAKVLNNFEVKPALVQVIGTAYSASLPGEYIQRSIPIVGSIFIEQKPIRLNTIIHAEVGEDELYIPPQIINIPRIEPESFRVISLSLASPQSDPVTPINHPFFYDPLQGELKVDFPPMTVKLPFAIPENTVDVIVDLSRPLELKTIVPSSFNVSFVSGNGPGEIHTASPISFEFLPVHQLNIRIKGHTDKIQLWDMKITTTYAEKHECLDYKWRSQTLFSNIPIWEYDPEIGFPHVSVNRSQKGVLTHYHHLLREEPDKPWQKITAKGELVWILTLYQLTMDPEDYKNKPVAINLNFKNLINIDNPFYIVKFPIPLIDLRDRWDFEQKFSIDNEDATGEVLFQFTPKEEIEVSELGYYMLDYMPTKDEWKGFMPQSSSQKQQFDWNDYMDEREK